MIKISKVVFRLLFFLSPLHLVDMLIYNGHNCVDTITIINAGFFFDRCALFIEKKVDDYFFGYLLVVLSLLSPFALSGNYL